MGRVFLDAYNKLVVETDNGVINPDGTASAEITSKETYTISVGDIAVLLKIVNNQDTVQKGQMVYCRSTESNEYCNSVFLITDADIKKELEGKDETIKKFKNGIESIVAYIDGRTSTYDWENKIIKIIKDYRTISDAYALANRKYNSLKQKVEQNNATSHFFRHNINIEA